MPSILILGAGWFGCHAAMTLLDLGITNFKIVDIENDFFCGSSSKNQNRLHMGFHYCRSYATRLECKIGYDRFLKLYENLTKKIKNNLYIIDKSCILDDTTYKNIYRYDNIKFKEINSPNLSFELCKDRINGIISVDERYIDFRLAKTFFKNKLGNYLIKNYDPSKLIDKTYDNEIYDYIIDCTFQKINDTIYEECISLLYKHNSICDFALTVVDGKFWSLYPYDISESIFTLTDVEYTPLKNLTTTEIKEKIEEKVLDYLPKFNSDFTYHGYFISHKIKPITTVDDRSLIFIENDGVFTFRAGKLTGIFAMEDILREKFT
jgi:hypothetical protein